ncbi:MAG: hypothetical protein AAGA66_08640 [Bacteroidota bacterium]
MLEIASYFKKAYLFEVKARKRGRIMSADTSIVVVAILSLFLFLINSEDFENEDLTGKRTKTKAFTYLMRWLIEVIGKPVITALVSIGILYGLLIILEKLFNPESKMVVTPIRSRIAKVDPDYRPSDYLSKKHTIQGAWNKGGIKGRYQK